MRHTLLIFVMFILTSAGCIHSQNRLPAGQLTSEADVLDFYRQYSGYTDPGTYVYLFENLPESLEDLCNLITAQFIHPFAELPQYRDVIPEERWNEFHQYPTVQAILKGLLSHDSRGLALDRKPADRLVLICQQNSILLASIMKYRGIPARVRYGHATYLMPGFHASHAVCEVWNEKEKRWMLVDPTTTMVDFSREKFDFSNEAWLKMQKGEIDPDLFGIPPRYSGPGSVTGKVFPDLASLLGTEYPAFAYPPVMEAALENKPLPAEHIETLTSVCDLMKSIDAENLSRLQKIYTDNPDFQMTKSFEPDLGQVESYSTSEQNSPHLEKEPLGPDVPENRPDIEFADIPAGTFTMGSPVDERGRKEDEVQHEVTLSGFRMSKYPVTIAQYNQFCKATGRKKPWYGLGSQGDQPVSQVTWRDAAAFAEWMGCRLPTEAEWEYAARAGTNSAFYTGDTLTKEQAHFGGKKNPLPVGSFPPNGFGLYDMHGNIWEWTHDWYGEYDPEDNVNPQGPKTGTKKVDRGGGFYDAAWKCRSAFRGGGTPPGNRGSGIGFRLVKSK